MELWGGLLGFIFSVFICVFFFFLVNVAEECIFSSLDAYGPVLVRNKPNAFPDLQLQSINHPEFHSCTCRSGQLNLMKPRFPPQRALKFAYVGFYAIRFQTEGPFWYLTVKDIVFY